MKRRALDHFRGPERYNCAQSVYRSLEKHQEVPAEKVSALASAGSGRAPEGLCGALYAAKLVLSEDRKTELRGWFEENGGSIHCREIRKARKMSCRDCVAVAADFVDRNLKKEGNYA
ncbi:MAG: C_GCAxxG_C_C family protein [Pontiellaceae bacterium]|nr:C_GCAxxG_C_C family protein [Pontiellaceae bacterium]